MKKLRLLALTCALISLTLAQAQKMVQATPDLVKRCHNAQFFCHEGQKEFVLILYCGIDGVGGFVLDNNLHKIDEIDIDCTNQDIVMESKTINIAGSGKADCKRIEIRNHYPTIAFESVKPKDGMPPSVFMYVYDANKKLKNKFEFDYDADYEEGTSMDFFESAEKCHKLEGYYTEGVDNCMDLLYLMLKNYVK